MSDKLNKKWGPLLPKGPQKAILAALLQNEADHLNHLLGEKAILHGPYYCDREGTYVSVDDAADPKYDPNVAFHISEYQYNGPNRTPNRATKYVYYPSADVYHKLADDQTITIIDVKDIDDWIIEELFKREPIIYGPSVSDFTKFAFPLIRRSYANSLAQPIISVQPMTQPASLVFYMNQKYGKTANGPK